MNNKEKRAISPIYNRIRELASQHKISLAELERSLQFSNGIISTWKFSNPSIDKISKVANYFNISTDYLLGNTNDPSPADLQERLASKSDIKNPKIKILARKIDSKELSDAQIDSISSFIDSMFEDKDEKK